MRAYIVLLALLATPLAIGVAQMPGNSSCVKVRPPLFCNGPSIGSVRIWSPGPVKKPPAVSLLRLYPSEVTVPELKMFGTEAPALLTHRIRLSSS